MPRPGAAVASLLALPLLLARGAAGLNMRAEATEGFDLEEGDVFEDAQYLLGSRGEAWSALGEGLGDADAVADQTESLAVSVAGEGSGEADQAETSAQDGDEMPEDPHACDGCQMTVNLRCEGMRSSRSSPFHRIQDCLLPVYGLVKLARDAAFAGKRVCAVTWLDIWEGLNLRTFLVNVSRVHWYHIINENQACTKKLKYHTVNRTIAYMATEQHLATFFKDPLMIEAHRIDVAKNLPMLQMDATWLGKQAAPTDGEKANIVAIKRTRESRVFRPIAFEELVRGLHRTGHPVIEYTGAEPIYETIKMFNQAAGTVGYHGAAWVNTYFTAHWHCNVHLSTFVDLEGKVPWRIHRELMVNPWGSWSLYFLPLKIILDANHVLADAFQAREEKDHFIKDLAWIPLRDVDIQQVTWMMSTCLKDPEGSAHVQPDSQVLALKHPETRGLNANLLSEQVKVSGTLTSLGRDACSGCDVTVDMRCKGLKFDRTAYYHTVAECLLQQYEMIQVARETSSNSTARLCALTWTSEGGDIRSFLQDLVGFEWHKIVDEDDKCARGLKIHTVDRPLSLGAISTDYRKALKSNPSVIHAYPINVRRNLAWMHKDAVNIVGAPQATTVIIQGAGPRKFTMDTLSRLAGRTRRFMKMPVIIIYGEENVKDMIKHFTNTGNVMGFYGDLWVNTLFTATPHCSTQVSTYLDFNRSLPWRTHANMSSLNPLGDWYFKFVHPIPLLKANRISNTTFASANHAAKDLLLRELKEVPLSEDDIIAVASRTFMCWQNKERAYRNAQRFFTRDFR